ncbi:hypothetical protein [Paenibacillus germinis]|uniref:hypothetical protein n=1 Tax=Paenibacillus germinis TaxID=2654979 RepID=UPI001FE8C1BD
MNERSIGKSIIRKESWEKVTGTAQYTDDFSKIGLLHAKLAVSPHAHAKIISVDSSEARKVPGVKAVIIGKDHPILTGSPLEDRPPPLQLIKSDIMVNPLQLSSRNKNTLLRWQHC